MMKRLVALASAMVLFAVATQAASVDWTVSGQTGKTFYVYNGDLSSAIAALQDGATYTKETLALPSGHEATGTMAARGSSGSVANVESSITVLVVDTTVADGNKFFYTVASTSGYTYEPPNQGTNKLKISSWSTGTFKAVPEPTSVALIALGLVALGLKRKVA